MMKIIVVDARDSFLDDINTRMMLDERNIEIVSTLNSADNLHNAIVAFHPDLVVISDNIVETQKDWDYAGVTVVGFAANQNGKDIFANYEIACYGIVKNTAHLLNLLEGPVPILENKTSSKTSVTEQSTPFEMEKESPDIKEQYIAFDSSKESDIAEEISNSVQSETLNAQKQEPEMPPEPILQKQPVKSQMQILHERKKAVYGEGTAEKRLQRDLVKTKPPAKVVTVYAAKGGVGKTTLSTEIAVYLALTGHGRGRYRVCIVDYNIDFGDVRSTLGLEHDGADMCLWAMEIRERIDNGEDAKSIIYSKKEMEEYLQIMKDTGLYALCAPNTHEESMDIGQEELEVMLRNIIHNGDFDFVVCDTGNNTRDSSFCALEMADHVLLVATQDVNAASCNKSAVETFEAINFDTNKIKLVINNAMSIKYTGVLAEDVEACFKEFACIARIKHDMDLIKANNLSQPIVLQPNHEVTRELRKIVSFLTNGETVETEDPKKNFFARFIKRR